MARFDVYRNPNPRASHGLLLDVQSDLVRTHTRWCVPLLRAEVQLGAAESAVDADGVLRHAFVTAGPTGRPYPSLALALLLPTSWLCLRCCCVRPWCA